MGYLYDFLTWMMDGCYRLCHNYGAAVVLFTFLSRIVLIPVTVWTYRNSVTMMKMQADISALKVRYYGNRDILAQKQAELFKENRYHPLSVSLPLLIQLVLLAGVVGTVRAGMENPAVDMSFGFLDLGQTPCEEGLRLAWIPLAAGVSSWILCVAQNADNVLQSGQTKYNKYLSMLFSVGLSLYLGWYAPAATVLYWVCGNFLAILQMYLLNSMMKPWKQIDYERLEKSRRDLETIQNVGKKTKVSREDRQREKKDYKKFFSIVNKHLVFYSESNGFYKYYRGIIEYILEHTSIVVHYITSDPRDGIFEMQKENPQIRAYYVGENRLITLMMTMDADMVVMTMPDLENYHIKRSYVRRDIEYVFVPHGMGSNNMGMRKGSVDHFDTVFCAGPHQESEIRETEAVYGLSAKEVVRAGYPLLDEIRSRYQSVSHANNGRKKILIAPSWQADNIVDSCIEELLGALEGKGYEIIVRPHPQEVRLKKEYMDVLRQKYTSGDIEIQTDFSSDVPVLEADLLITDWSGISWEYAFGTLRPVLFIDTPMKVENPDYQKIETVPLNILLRDRLGKRLRPDQMDQAPRYVEELICHAAEYEEQIEKLMREYIYNIGCSAQISAEYMIRRILEKAEKRKARKTE